VHPLGGFAGLGTVPRRMMRDCVRALPPSTSKTYSGTTLANGSRLIQAIPLLRPKGASAFADHKRRELFLFLAFLRSTSQSRLRVRAPRSGIRRFQRLSEVGRNHVLMLNSATRSRFDQLGVIEMVRCGHLP
jgi:hypothetical protein